MNGMEGIFGIIGIGAGLYSLYAWFQLKFKGIINTSILVPKDTNIKKCKDKEAYRAAAGPKLLVLAVVLSCTAQKICIIPTCRVQENYSG